MNKTIIAISVAIVGLALPRAAAAWDGAGAWYRAAEESSPGSGGIVGTGGARDYRITCEDCHVERSEAGQIDLSISFTPPLDTAGGEPLYEPGRRYTVDVELVGEFLTGPCDQYMAHTNSFAANFESTAGEPAGRLESDSGQNQASCPSEYTDLETGTTTLYGDCEVIFPRNGEDQTRWRFYWRAPAAGFGETTMYYGAVDGDCAMNSMGDAVIVDMLVMSEGVASVRVERPWRYAFGGLLALPLLGLLGFARRRRLEYKRRGRWTV